MSKKHTKVVKISTFTANYVLLIWFPQKIPSCELTWHSGMSRDGCRVSLQDQSLWNRDPDPDLRSDWAAVDRSFSGSKTQIWSEPPKICVSQPWKRDEQGFSFQIVVTRDFWLGLARARIVGPMKFESGSGSDFLFSFRTDLDLGLGLSFKGIGNMPYTQNLCLEHLCK